MCQSRREQTVWFVQSRSRECIFRLKSGGIQADSGHSTLATAPGARRAAIAVLRDDYLAVF